MSEPELCADAVRAELVDKLRMMVSVQHDPSLLNSGFRNKPKSNNYSFMALKKASWHTLRMSFSERLATAFKAAGYKNRAKAAEALGISEQRMYTYAKGRVPPPDMLQKMAATFNTSVDYLLGVTAPGASDSDLRDILQRILELEGIQEDRAGIISNAFFAARELLDADYEEQAADPRFAARAAWQLLKHPE